MQSSEIHVTTEMLWQGTALFLILDTAFIILLVRHLKIETFRELKGPVALVAGIFWMVVWALMVTIFWDSVYQYVFPDWSRWFLPPAYCLLFAGVAFVFWRFALFLPGNPLLNFLIIGGLLGSLTHLWAIYRGILDKPPMLKGVSPLSAIVFPFFEFTLYWCLIVVLASLVRHRKGAASISSAGGIA